MSDERPSFARKMRVHKGALKAGISFAAIIAAIAVAACSPQPPLEANYEICNSTGCGDNVVIVIDNNS